MLDDALVRDLLRSAAGSGAEDTAVVSSCQNIRTDILNANASRVDTQFSNKEHNVFYAAVGNAECSAEIPDSLTPETAKNLVIQTTKSAKLANVWGTSFTHTPFSKTLIQSTPKSCPDRQIYGDNGEPVWYGLNQIKPSPADLIREISQNVQRLAPKFGCNLRMEVIDFDERIWVSSGFQQVRRYLTTFKQEILLPGQRLLKLPDYEFDGAGIDPQDSWHKQMLSATDVAPFLSQAYQYPGDFEEYHGFGLILSPWAVGVLAHEARHLGIDMTSSGKMTLDADSCLFSPPVKPPSCRGFALRHALNNKPTLGFLYARTPSGALIVDIPMRWSRKGSVVDVEFAYASVIENQQITK